MLKAQLLHPQILGVLGKAGHSSKVLISDGNYPHWTTRGPNAEVVFLNLAPGTVKVTEALKAVCTAVPVEKAEVMQYDLTGQYGMTQDPPIWGEHLQTLRESGNDIPLTRVERFAFYDLAARPDVCLTIATGEQRIWANILLTVGVIKPT